MATPFDQATTIAKKLGKPVDQLGFTDLISGGVDPVSASQLIGDMAQISSGGNIGGVSTLSPYQQATQVAYGMGTNVGQLPGSTLIQRGMNPVTAQSLIGDVSQVGTGGNVAGVTTGVPGTAAQALAKQLGINLYTGKDAKAVVDAGKPPAVVDTGAPPDVVDAGKPPVVVSAGPRNRVRSQLPGLVPFRFNPSRTLDPTAARQQAGQRAFMQLQPQFLAKEQQKRLALQGLDMLRQRLQQGVEQASASTLRNVPKFVDQARVLRASQGLSESGFLNADQTNIQGEALNTIAQNAEQARLQEAQAADQVNLANQGTDAEIAALQGQVSLGPSGEYTGSLVDTMTQDLLDKNAQFTMEERRLALEENRITNDMNLARYNAQVASDQGDERIAQQWEQQAQQHQDSLSQLQVQKDQLAETKRANQVREQASNLAQQVDVVQKFGPAGGVWAFDALNKFNAGDTQGALASFAQADKAINEMSAGKEAAAVQSKMLQSQMEYANKFKLPSTRQAVLAYFVAQAKGDPNATALGAQAEAAARAEGDLAFAPKREFELWKMENIDKPLSSYKASIQKTAPKDYTASLGPTASMLINEAQRAESQGDTATADALYAQAAVATKEWKTSTTPEKVPAQGDLTEAAKAAITSLQGKNPATGGPKYSFTAAAAVYDMTNAGSREEVDAIYNEDKSKPEIASSAVDKAWLDQMYQYAKARFNR